MWGKYQLITQSPCLSLCPCLSVCPCLSLSVLSVPVCLCLSLSVPVCPCLLTLSSPLTSQFIILYVSRHLISPVFCLIKKTLSWFMSRLQEKEDDFVLLCEICRRTSHRNRSLGICTVCWHLCDAWWENRNTLKLRQRIKGGSSDLESVYSVSFKQDCNSDWLQNSVSVKSDRKFTLCCVLKPTELKMNVSE